MAASKPRAAATPPPGAGSIGTRYVSRNSPPPDFSAGAFFHPSMSDRDTYRDTLLYALAIAGSERGLAEQLRVTVPEGKKWLDGVDAIPGPKFPAGLDAVIDTSPPARQRC